MPASEYCVQGAPVGQHHDLQPSEEDHHGDNEDREPAAEGQARPVLRSVRTAHENPRP